MTVNEAGEFDPHERKRNIYLNVYMLPFFYFDVDAKHGIEFRHSTSNAFRIQHRAENGVS